MMICLTFQKKVEPYFEPVEKLIDLIEGIINSKNA
jgi:hypothetical protein